MRLDLGDYLVLGLVGLYLVLVPYTKVEESFNIQAIHDILFHGLDLDQYDHLEFPQPVPRTFVGALVVAAVAKPLQAFVALKSKFDLQLIARGVLGAINCYALSNLRHTIAWTCEGKHKHGFYVSLWFLLFQSVQFHQYFYASRPLPNMFAMPLVNFAWASVISGQVGLATALLSFAGVVFRAEILLLGLCLAVVLVLLRRMSLRLCIGSAIKGAAWGLLISVPVDSYLHNQWPTVPELQGFVYNVWHGKSANWGVQPYSAYFVQHLPNLLMNPVIVALFALGLGKCTDPTRRLYIKCMAAACGLYMAIYALLPHKEWRFIIYVVPVFNLLAALAAQAVFRALGKRIVSWIYTVFVLVTCVLTLAASLGKVYISSYNYYGGQALSELHDFLPHPRAVPNTQVSADTKILVHMDIPVCMTGVTRFGQEYHGAQGSPVIVYDKTEDVDSIADLWTSFDYLLSSVPVQDLPCETGFKWHTLRSVPAYRTVNISSILELQNLLVTDPIGTLKSPMKLTDLFSRLLILEDKAWIYQKVAT